jgi:hypothetical protein
VFALCFGSVEGEGALMLGDADVAGRFNVALAYTPLLDNPAHPHYYSVSLEALVVGGERLDVRPVRRRRPRGVMSGRACQIYTLVYGWFALRSCLLAFVACLFCSLPLRARSG